MTSNQGAPKGADVVGEREGLDREAHQYVSPEYKMEAFRLQRDDALDRAAAAEAQLEVYREALDKIAYHKPTGTWREIVTQLENIARAALREKP